MENVKENIAKNLTSLRLEKKLTQAELGEKINYSDKSISKWEHGETTPPIDVLKQLADFYDVSLDYLVTDSPDEIYDRVYNNKKNTTNKIIITILAVSLVWLIGTILYVYGMVFLQESFWILFVTAIPFSTIVLLVFNGIWGKRRFVFLLVSILIWSILASIFLSFIKYNIWPIFILGIPLQIAVVLWSLLKPSKMKKKINKKDA